MSRFRPAVMEELPRFWGGLVGYFTYESVSFFENIPNMLSDDKPLAHFIIPDELMIFDNIRHTLLCLTISFTDKESSPENAYESAKERLNTLIQKMQTCLTEMTSPESGTDFSLNPRQEDDNYRQMVKKTKEYIRAGDIIQAVVSQPFVCEPAPDVWSLYRAQRFVNPSRPAICQSFAVYVFSAIE